MERRRAPAGPVSARGLQGTGAPPGAPSPSSPQTRNSPTTRAEKSAARTKERAPMTHMTHNILPNRAAEPDIMAPDELECLKKRTLARLADCLARFGSQIARDWAYCGK